ncbi:DUF3238 domain-containing protein [Halocatena marina]|uniref:DUF3238 domain-containing protein n=1 Tax=Halocatena marina TaxID=2934937 RepID=A0ABD5YKG2_9EURY|nr:DUF3238 domain-containing protein [Halocatena marina]
MAVSVVKLRIATFIPDAWISSTSTPDGREVEFRGDNREFTPHTSHTGHSRVAQEIVVDFERESVITHPETGQSMERITEPDGATTIRTAAAQTDGISCTDTVWTGDGVRFTAAASVSNPLSEDSPPVDFRFEIHFSADGTIGLTGRHDGFPCFEVYKQVEFGAFETVYTYDYRKAEASPKSLADPMDQTVERTV